MPFIGIGVGIGRQRFASGGGGGFDADYQAVLDYATTQGYTLPSSGQQILQNQLVVDLKNGGIWSKLDTFGVFATDGDSDFALIDWIRLSDYTAINSPTFTTNEGFTGDGTSSYIDLNYNGSINRVNYADDSAHMSVWAKTIGILNSIASSDLGQARSSLDKRATVVNGINSSVNSTGTLASSVGFIMFSRYSSSNFNQYNNALLRANALQVRNTSGGGAVLLRTTGGFSDSEISFVSLGSDLTAEALSYYNALNTYITSI
jgi:hypothetical protein